MEMVCRVKLNDTLEAATSLLMSFILDTEMFWIELFTILKSFLII